MRRLIVCIGILLAGCLHVPPPVANIATEQTKQMFSLPPQVCANAMAMNVPIEQSEQRGCNGFVRLLRAGETLKFLQGNEVVESLQYQSVADGNLELQRGAYVDSFQPFSPIKIGELTAGYVISYSQAWDSAVLYVPMNGLNPVHEVQTVYGREDFAKNTQEVSNKLGAVHPVPNGTCLAATMNTGHIGRVVVVQADVGKNLTLVDTEGGVEDAGLVLGVKGDSLMVFWYGDMFSECM